MDKEEGPLSVYCTSLQEGLVLSWNLSKPTPGHQAQHQSDEEKQEVN